MISILSPIDAAASIGFKVKKVQLPFVSAIY